MAPFITETDLSQALLPYTGPADCGDRTKWWMLRYRFAPSNWLNRDGLWYDDYIICWFEISQSIAVDENYSHQRRLQIKTATKRTNSKWTVIKTWRRNCFILIEPRLPFILKNRMLYGNPLLVLQKIFVGNVWNTVLSPELFSFVVLIALCSQWSGEWTRTAK